MGSNVGEVRETGLPTLSFRRKQPVIQVDGAHAAEVVQMEILEQLPAAATVGAP